MNNKERELWIMNDESLYLWFISTKLSLRKFIKLWKRDIDLYINNVREKV